MDAKFPGDLIYVLGETKNELGGGEYYQMMDQVGLNVPKVDVKEVWPLYIALHRAIQEGLVSSAHAVARGGLGIHLALVAMGGEFGADIQLEKVPAWSGLSNTVVLFSESAGRFVVTVDPEKEAAFKEIFEGMKAARVGLVTESPLFCITGTHGDRLLEEDIHELKAAWKKPFGDLI
jgi:phosphoribosylformylglycinamidine synthase